MTLSRDRILKHAEEYRSEAPAGFYEKEENQLERLPKVFEERRWDWSDLEWIVRWKAARSIGYFERNNRDIVDEVITNVLETQSTYKKVNLMTGLKGVQVKMASAFLLFMDPEKYTVLDWRASDTLVEEGHLPTPVSQVPSIEEYINYLDVFRSVAEKFEVDMRTLDRALWVMSGDN